MLRERDWLNMFDALAIVVATAQEIEAGIVLIGDAGEPTVQAA